MLLKPNLGSSVTTKTKQVELRRRGVPICRGVAIGHPFFFSLIADTIPDFSVAIEDVEHEVQRYRLAVARSMEDVHRLKKQLEQEKIIEGAAILEGQIQMMQDPLLTNEVE